MKSKLSHQQKCGGPVKPKLWHVRVESSVVVLARNADDALDQALQTPLEALQCPDVVAMIPFEPEMEG